MSTINPKLTSQEIMEVPCIVCNAPAGRHCSDPTTRKTIIGFHVPRFEHREKLPINPKPDLNATDKAIIIGYAFVTLCDSVSTKSFELFGTFMSPADVQRFFCANAMKDAREDGLIR